MPSGRAWVDLLKSTFRSVGKKDISGLYSLEWKHAKQKLIAGDREMADGTVAVRRRDTRALDLGQPLVKN